MRNDKMVLILTLTTFLLIIASQSGAVPTLTIGNVSISVGGEGQLPITLSGGVVPFAGVNAKIILPQGVSCTGVVRGALLDARFQVDYLAVDAAQHAVTVIAYSGEATFQNGEVLLLQLAVAPGTSAGGPIAVAFAQTNAAGVNAKYALSNETGSVSVAPITTVSGSVTVTAFVDTDSDGLPDSWEMEHFGTLNWGPSDDPDGDGVNNGDEYESGTNPDLFVGDVNNDHVVNLSDALLILRYYYNDPTVVMPNMDAAYVNADAAINLSDALLVLRRYYNEIGPLGKSLDAPQPNLMQQLVDSMLQDKNN